MIPEEHRNATGLLIFLDTNQVDDASPASVWLRTLDFEGWIQLQRTDTVDTELSSANDEKRDHLLAQSQSFVESFGPLVLDHSRLDHAVLGSDEDSARLHLACDVLWDRSEGLSKNNLRDAMHVSTAVRYGANGLVTRDKRLLKRADAIRAAFDGFLLVTPETAFRVALRLRARATVRALPGLQGPPRT